MSKRRRSERPGVRPTRAATARGHPAQPAAMEGSQRPARATERRALGFGAPQGWLLAAATAAGLLALAIYLLTLEPSLPTGDSGELISAAWILGVAHPPGYPVWTLLAHLFEALPFGSPAYDANLMSAVLDAATIVILFVLIAQLLRIHLGDVERRWIPIVAAALGALLVAFSSVFWAYSIVAEVFALNNLLAAALLALLLSWHRRPSETRLLWLAALLTGLALANQQTIVLLAPGLLLLLLSGMRRLRMEHADRPLGLRLRDFVAAPGLLLVGLIPYLYLPLAARGQPSLNWQDPQTLDRFIAVVTRASYGTFQLAAGDQRGSVLEQLQLFGQHLVAAYSPIGILLATVGAIWLWRRDRWESGALLLALLVSGPAFLAYANPLLDSPLSRGVVERFYILPGLSLAILAGIGAGATLAWLSPTRRLPRRVAPLALGLGAAAALALPLASGAGHFSTVDRSHDYVAIHYAEDLLEPLPHGALLITRGDHNYTSLIYAQTVEHMRPDVIALDVELLKTPSYVADARRRFPGLQIPFNAYDEGATNSLADLVRVNIDQRPVFYSGKMNETHWTDGFDEEYLGLVHRLVPKGTASDPYAALRASYRQVQLQFPDRTYPTTTWENLIGLAYSNAAFDVGFALQGEGPPEFDQVAEQMYRTAIRLDPERAVAYKNLGLLLADRGGDPKEIIALWERYLSLHPSDPQLDAIRGALNDLKKRVH